MTLLWLPRRSKSQSPLHGSQGPAQLVPTISPISSPPAHPHSLLSPTPYLPPALPHTHWAHSCFRAFALTLLSAWYTLPLVLSAASSSSLQVCAQISPYQWDFPCAFHYILEIVPATFICIHSFPCFLCLKSIYHPLTYLIFSLLGFNNFAFLPLELQLCKQVCLSLLFNSVCLKPGTRPSTQ